MQLSIRELKEQDLEALTNYWLGSDHQHLINMGVDLEKLPSASEFQNLILEQLILPKASRQTFCYIWQSDGIAIGHSNINKIRIGQDAYMHLHLWNGTTRKRGLGTALVKMSIVGFFETYELQRLYCEPYALNPAPHRTLEKIGFTMEKEYITIPGSINFEQPVKRWVLYRHGWKNL